MDPTTKIWLALFAGVVIGSCVGIFVMAIFQVTKTKDSEDLTFLAPGHYRMQFPDRPSVFFEVKHTPVTISVEHLIKGPINELSPDAIRKAQISERPAQT